MENVTGREFHAVADLFPLLRGAAFDELVADIRNNGLREPILVDAEGRILDGRNRYRACLEAGVEPHFTTWKGEGPLPDLALSLNLRRRHLNESQRAMVAARLAKMMEAEASRRRGRRRGEIPANLQGIPRGESRVRAGQMVNVSPRLISYAINVAQNGCEAVIAAVESGELPVSSASHVAKLPPEEQARLAAGGAREIARKVRELRGGQAKGGKSWPFGALATRPAGAHVSGEYSIVLLWVHADGLDRAVEVLQAGGFRYEPSEAPRE